ncbi:hypothetical protein GCM10028807_40390 [Spirosoma daeguense]
MNFDLIAPVYDILATLVFGRRLLRAQVVWLTQIPANASVLIVGGGTGWLLEQVLKRCQPKRVVYLEKSQKMIDLATQRMAKRKLLGRVEFRVGDELLLSADERFNVVMTPFVLDLFTENTLRSRFIPQLRNVLKTDSYWFVTDFVRPLVWWQKLLLWLMLRFFRTTAHIEAKQLADWQKLLTETELKLLLRSAQVSGMVSSEVWILQSETPV